MKYSLPQYTLVELLNDWNLGVDIGFVGIVNVVACA